ncbi:MAG TPA: AAA family ATPase, partial [Candidatus Acidoferrales bacterium]|nr:AAA family ATPase [Candidatus Acidoferrales bacterium]
MWDTRVTLLWWWGGMRLKQLEVIGFKSFAHRTVLDFPSGITAVVGPNGCGKSNVVDAIRWVLGEQSPRHLRGDSMEDVIFKGNDSTAPLGMAQVSLTFENDPEPKQATDLDVELSTLPAHLRDLAEITVSRRYHRSGESEYLINKIP